jgi:23S rRNA (uracil1939-C5)-methyltransferase
MQRDGRSLARRVPGATLSRGECAIGFPHADAPCSGARAISPWTTMPRPPKSPQHSRPSGPPRPSRESRDPRPHNGGREAGVPVGVGEELSVPIFELAAGPDAIGRIGDYVVFVPGALPGEKVRVRIASASRKYARGTVVKVEKASPARETPRCRHFGICGGCHMQHMAYDAQLDMKEDRVADELSWALGHKVAVESIRGPNEPWEQRTKVGFQVGGRPGALHLGLFKVRSRDIVAIKECPVQDPKATALALKIGEIASRLKIAPWKEDGNGTLRAVVVRLAPGTDEMHVTLVAGTPSFNSLDRLAVEVIEAGAKGVSINVNAEPGPMLMGDRTRLVAGQGRIEAVVGGVRYLMSPGAFFQTSRYGVETLVDEVRNVLADVPKDASVVDLYCGVGLFALALADRVDRVVGIEENAQAITDARDAAKLNGFARVRFIAGRAESRIRELAEREKSPFAVIVDPPREGCDPSVLEVVANILRPQRIVYVSCEAESLGRDGQLLEELGYVLVRARPIDMFPHVYHVETVAVFERPARVAAADEGRRDFGRPVRDRR